MAGAQRHATCWAVVPAAGVGRRMGNKVPKQYLKLRGQTVIWHTLSRLLGHPDLRGVVVALAGDDGWWPEFGLADHPRLMCTVGGEQRCHSVLSGLGTLLERADPEDWVLVHDVVRPCVRAEDISKLISRGREHSIGAVLGMRVKDTMKRADLGGEVLTTIDRDNLWHAHTPQMFRIHRLKTAIEHALNSNVMVTDEAMAMEMMGERPCMVEGHADNVKLTVPEDVGLIEFILGRQDYEA